jgi:nitrile hydratase subunit beta
MTNSIHDMGGVHGFGPVEAPPAEPPFHARWEGRVFAMQRAMGFTGLWTIDAGRAGLEQLPPLEYLRSSYYRRWFLGLEQRLLQRGLVAADEIAAGHSLQAGTALPRTLERGDVDKTLVRGEFARPTNQNPRFKEGDTVRTKNINPTTHTRLPRYARAKVGRVDAVRGCHVFPDSAALGQGENPQWLYTVVFSARELWGADADPAVEVSIEAFEPYLDPA